MKKNLIVLLLVIFTLPSFSAAKKFGKSLTLKEKTKISEIISNPDKFNGKKVQVEGAIVGVCEKRGCWINISGDKEQQKLRFKVEDGVIVFPMSVKGKNVVAEGIVSFKKYSKEELIEQGMKHAKEEGKEFDSSTVTEGKTVLQLNGEGAEVK